MQSGPVRVTLNEARLEEAVMVNPGDILVIPQNTNYRYHSIDPKVESKLTAFRIRFFETWVRLPMTSDSFYPFIEHFFTTFAHIQDGISPRIQYLIDQYRSESESALMGREEMLQSASTSIFIEVLRKARETTPSRPANNKNHLIVQGVRRYLNENLNRSFSLDDVGWKLNLSGEHVARVFKQETKQTIFQYLKQLRIDKASYLLAKTNQKIHMIATETGFSSHPLFTRAFRESVGVTPDKYRAQRKESISLIDAT
tara:strand:+ start:12468 stop:13235 length:768 start_codon:yes stop_codon:yes gene_type:complete